MEAFDRTNFFMSWGFVVFLEGSSISFQELYKYFRLRPIWSERFVNRLKSSFNSPIKFDRGKVKVEVKAEKFEGDTKKNLTNTKRKFSVLRENRKVKDKEMRGKWWKSISIDFGGPGADQGELVWLMYVFWFFASWSDRPEIRWRETDLIFQNLRWRTRLSASWSLAYFLKFLNSSVMIRARLDTSLLWSQDVPFRSCLRSLPLARGNVVSRRIDRGSHCGDSFLLEEHEIVLADCRPSSLWPFQIGLGLGRIGNFITVNSTVVWPRSPGYDLPERGVFPVILHNSMRVHWRRVSSFFLILWFMKGRKLPTGGLLAIFLTLMEHFGFSWNSSGAGCPSRIYPGPLTMGQIPYPLYDLGGIVLYLIRKIAKRVEQTHKNMFSKQFLLRPFKSPLNLCWHPQMDLVVCCESKVLRWFFYWSNLVAKERGAKSWKRDSGSRHMADVFLRFFLISLGKCFAAVTPKIAAGSPHGCH